MKQRILLLVVCLMEALALFPKSADSFFSQYNFHFITESAGLPYSSVSHIFKDSKGYVWVATNNGIGRYDGYQFLNYNTQTEPIRLKNNFVHEFCEDNFHRLWIASEGGVDILDLNTYALVELSLPEDSPVHRMMEEYICMIYKDREGDLWISSKKNLWCIKLDEAGNVKTYYKLEKECTSSVHAVTDAGWAVCAGIDNRVCRMEKLEGHRLKASELSDNLIPFSEDWRISSMEADGDRLWIGSNRGLFKYDQKEGTLQRYRYSTHRPGMLSQAYITDIEFTGQGQLIVSTLNGLNVYHRDTDTFSFIRQTGEKSGTSINCNAINCLLADGETVWIGTETGGVNLLSPKSLRAELWSCGTFLPGSKASVPINAIGEDRDGNLWMGLVERGMIKWDKETQLCSHYLFSPGDVTSISNNTINGMLIDSYNQLWVYTWGVGINRLDLNVPDNQRFRRYTQKNTPGLEGDFISSACEDIVNRRIWFGSTRGVLFYDRQTDVFTRVEFDKSDNEFEAVHTLLIDGKKRLWVGTTQGVFIVDLTSFSGSGQHFDYTYLKYKLDHPESTQLEKINCILEDREGGIWLGGNGSGLYRLVSDKDNHFVFKNYTVRHGLSGNTIFGMVETGQGDLWLTTNDGISRLNLHTMTFSNYTQADGLPTTQFYWNGIRYSERQDLIYVATADGLIILHSNQDKVQPTNSRVLLSSLTVGGNVIYPSGGSYLDGECITQSSRILLHEKDGRFIVGFTTLNYGNSGRIRFAYRLKGYEKEWNETHPGEYMARYNAVTPGDYVLQVRATDELGRWSDTTTEVKVKITPYFYKSSWFYLFLFVVVCLSIYLFYQWKTRSYREQQTLLKKEVELRTKELEVQNKRLEAMAQHVREITEEKIAFFTNITHEFRTPVTLIHGPIERALKETQDEEVKVQLQIAERNSGYLLSLVNELMDFRKLDADKVVLNRQSTDIVKFLSELLLPFKVFAGERHIEILTYFRLDNPCLMIDAGYMRKVIVNLVSNAIKFTADGGCIRIFVASVRGENGEKLLSLNVCDTGNGIVEEDMEKIFDKFYQSRRSVKYPVYGQSGTGIGLFLCRKIVELHGGKIYARNNHGPGASFRILMPLIPGGEVKSTEAEGTVLEQVTDALPVVAADSKKETILVVEDNTDMRLYICSLLKREYNLLEARNGEEALCLIRQHTVDLIISDLMMPVMDGLELSRRVKEKLATSHIPFLMLTALHSEAQERKSFEIGVDEYLCKPFDEEVLRLRIRNILNLRNKYKKMFSTSSNVDELHVSEESRDKAFITNAVNLMKENYADAEYNLERFVRDMGYSKTLVNNKMQDLTGQPIGQFMKNYRLNVALQMMEKASGGANVSEIAYAVGFNDPKYFTKCFKELFGCLPSTKLNRK